MAFKLNRLILWNIKFRNLVYEIIYSAHFTHQSFDTRFNFQSTELRLEKPFQFKFQFNSLRIYEMRLEKLTGWRNDDSTKRGVTFWCYRRSKDDRIIERIASRCNSLGSIGLGRVILLRFTQTNQFSFTFTSTATTKSLWLIDIGSTLDLSIFRIDWSTALRWSVFRIDLLTGAHKNDFTMY